MTTREIAKTIGADEQFLHNAIDVQNIETDNKTDELIVIEAVYKLCTEIIEQRNEAKKTLENIYTLFQTFSEYLRNRTNKEKRTQRDKGFVYIASCASKNIYKIGMTKDISAREKSLRTGNHQLELFAYTQSNNPQNLESLLHELYKNKNISGEWFELNEVELADLIASFCFTLAIEGDKI